MDQLVAGEHVAQLGRDFHIAANAVIAADAAHAHLGPDVAEAHVRRGILLQVVFHRRRLLRALPGDVHRALQRLGAEAEGVVLVGEHHLAPNLIRRAVHRADVDLVGGGQVLERGGALLDLALVAFQVEALDHEVILVVLRPGPLGAQLDAAAVLVADGDHICGIGFRAGFADVLGIHVFIGDLARGQRHQLDVEQLVGHLDGVFTVLDHHGQLAVIGLDREVDGILDAAQLQQRDLLAVQAPALGRLAEAHLHLHADVGIDADLEQQRAHRAAAGALAGGPLEPAVQEAVQLRVDAGRGHDAHGIQVGAEHADAQVDAHARANAQHAEGVEVGAEVRLLDVLDAAAAVAAEVLVLVLLAAAPDLGAEVIGELLRVFVADARADHAVDLEADGEVHLEPDVDDAHRVHRRVEGAQVFIDEVDVLGVVGQHVGILRGQVAADARRHRALLGVVAVLLFVGGGVVVRAEALVALGLFEQLVAALDQVLRRLLAGVLFGLVALRAGVVRREVVDHFLPFLLGPGIGIVLGLGRHRHAQAGIGARLERRGDVQAGGQARAVLVALDLDHRGQQEFLLQHGGGLDLQGAHVADGDLDGKADGKFGAQALLALEMLQVDEHQEGDVHVADLDLFRAVREAAQLFQRDLAVVRLDGHVADLVAMLQAVKIDVLVHDQPGQEIAGLVHEAALHHLLAHLALQLGGFLLGGHDVHLGHLHIQQQLVTHDLLLGDDVIVHDVPIPAGGDAGDQAVARRGIIRAAERAGVEDQIVAGLQAGARVQTEIGVGGAAEIQRIGGQLDLSVLGAPVVGNGDVVRDEEDVLDARPLIGVPAVAQHLGDFQIGDVGVGKAVRVRLAVAHRDDAARGYRLVAGIGHDAGAVVLPGDQLAVLAGLEVDDALEFHALHLVGAKLDHVGGEADVHDLLLEGGDVVFDHFGGHDLAVRDKAQLRGVGDGGGIEIAALPEAVFGPQQPALAGLFLLLQQQLLQDQHLLHGQAHVLAPEALQAVVLREAVLRLQLLLRRRGQVDVGRGQHRQGGFGQR